MNVGFLTPKSPENDHFRRFSPCSDVATLPFQITEIKGENRDSVAGVNFLDRACSLGFWHT